ncbi:MAG: hypothetical protein WC746_04660 [archaeon]
MIRESGKKRQVEVVQARDARVELFLKHLKATRGFNDTKLKQYLFKLPIGRLRAIQLMYEHYPGHTPMEVTQFASRAHEILEIKLRTENK